MTTIEFKELIKDNHLCNIFRNNLELILTVDQHYKHIVEMERLIALFKGGLSDYYKQHHPKQEEITQLCGEIAKNTRANKYIGDGVPFHDVYVWLAEFFPDKQYPERR